MIRITWNICKNWQPLRILSLDSYPSILDLMWSQKCVFLTNALEDSYHQSGLRIAALGVLANGNKHCWP